MKDEIKEILEQLKKLDNNYIILKEKGASFKATELEKKAHILYNYITNLQEKLKVSQTNEETYRLEMQDITKILGLDEHTTFDEVKEYATNLQERNEKAIEYFKYQLEQLDFYEDTKAKMLCAMGIVILQGEDKDANTTN